MSPIPSMLRGALVALSPILRDAALGAIQIWAARQLEKGSCPDRPWPGYPETDLPEPSDNPGAIAWGEPPDAPACRELTVPERMGAHDNVLRAWRRTASKSGAAPGADRQTLSSFGARLDAELDALSRALSSAIYRPDPVLAVSRPKPGGGTRRLGIPTIRDRVAQRAMCQILELRAEPAMAAWSYAYRPGRGGHDAIAAADALLEEGRRWVLRTDVKDCFDTIPHSLLLEEIAPVAERDPAALEMIRRVICSPRRSGRSLSFPGIGIPQGSPLSPLLANLFLDPVDKAMRETGHAMLRYADDILVACPTRKGAEAALDDLREALSGRGLRLNEAKCAIIDAEAEPFEFLGHLCAGRRWEPAPGKVDSLVAEIERRLAVARESGRTGLTGARAALAGWLAYYGKHTNPSGKIREIAERLGGGSRSRPRAARPADQDHDRGEIGLEGDKPQRDTDTVFDRQG